MILGLLKFWRGMKSHPHLRVPEESGPGEFESEAGKEDCQLLLLYFADGSFEDERDCYGVCCNTSNREEEELKEIFQKESKVRLKGLRKKIAYYYAA
jgi:hypothetical protein